MKEKHPHTDNSLIRKLPSFLRKLFPTTPLEKQAPQATAPPTDKRVPKIGLALSSGGAKGLCHIGVIEVLESNNIPIHAVSGSSMGAYVAALYASGCTVDEMKELAAEIGSGKTFSKLADPANPLKGIIHGNKARLHLEKTIQRRTFDSFVRQLLVATTDLDTYEMVIHREGVVSDAVHASCSIPGIVVPPMLHDRRLTDGGVVEPVPVQPLLDFTDVDHVIAVSTVRKLDDIDSPIRARELADIEAKLATQSSSGIMSTLGSITKIINPVAPGNVMDTLRRSLKAAQIRIASQSCKLASVSIYPAHDTPSNWDDYHRYEDFIEFGRNAALEMLPELKKLTRTISNDHSQKVSVVGGRVA